jgi:glycosyltransferase involved in cell wall biosynthesis
MKLAIVTDTFPPDVNGVAMTLERLAAGLIGRGHAVEVIHPGISGLQGEAGGGGFTEVCMPGFAVPRYAFARLGWPRPVFLQKRWQGRRPDVIYLATEGLLGYSALRAARKLRIPVVSGYHTHFPQYLTDYHLGLLGPAMLYWLRKLHNATSCTLVPTEETRQLLLSQGFRNVEIMERGVDTGLFHTGRRNRSLRQRWGAGPSDPVFLHVGRVAAEKNLALVAGFCWRYSPPERDIYRRIHDGAIGPVRAVSTTYNAAGFRGEVPRQEGWTDLEYQIRNWP